MEYSQNPGFKPPVPADDPDLDLYTIPSHSSWFSWNDIHEIERESLGEFFDGSSITRSPKIYKDYRDFIISKFREDPSRRLTFTDVRKSLVGDITYLQKVFSFLEKWGLINFGLTAPLDDDDKEDEKWKVRAEEGAPHGVKIVAVPNSLKPVVPPPASDIGGGGGDVVDDGFRFPPLASYTDVYGELVRRKGVICGNCKESCDSGHYEYTKEPKFVICDKCFKNKNYGDNKSAEDFKFVDSSTNSESPSASWTEAETLLLLESVLKHGDDWELVAQNVQTKTKLDCIYKLIQLPFGDLMLRHRKGSIWCSNGELSSAKQVQMASAELPDTEKPEESDKVKDGSHENVELEAKDQSPPPPKRICTKPVSDACSSLMKQVARISTMVGEHVTAAAAEAAVTVLCHENQCSREIFDDDDDDVGEKERTPPVEDSAMEEKRAQSEAEETIPLTLRMRAATATALGAAAAHAKLLADQEDREIENLVATIIETQMNKLERKLKHFEELEEIMEKEQAQMDELEESVVAERLDVLQRIFSAGIARSWDQTPLKSQTGGMVFD